MIESTLRKRLEAAETLDNEQVKELALAVREAYGLDGGRTRLQALLWNDLQGFCGMTRTTAVAGPDGRMDSLSMAVVEGRRQVALRLATLLEISQQKDTP